MQSERPHIGPDKNKTTAIPPDVIKHADGMDGELRCTKCKTLIREYAVEYGIQSNWVAEGLYKDVLKHLAVCKGKIENNEDRRDTKKNSIAKRVTTPKMFG